MTLSGTTFGGIAGAVLRGFSRPSKDPVIMDPFDPKPLDRAEVERLFACEMSPQSQSDSLRNSERHERETMSMIRAALYASD